MVSYRKSEEVHPGLRAIVAFAVKEHLSSSDLEQVYMLVTKRLSSSNLIKNPPKHQAFELASIVEKWLVEGMLLADFRSIIVNLKAHDSAEKDFEAFVEGLNSNEEDKQTLRSIVKNCLYGKLELRDIETGEIDIVRIPRQRIQPVPRVVARDLFALLKHLKGQNIEVTFEEK